MKATGRVPFQRPAKSTVATNHLPFVRGSCDNRGVDKSQSWLKVLAFLTLLLLVVQGLSAISGNQRLSSSEHQIAELRGEVAEQREEIAILRKRDDAQDTFNATLVKIERERDGNPNPKH